MEPIRGSFLSSDGKTDIAYKIWEPEVAPRAIVQLSHGMCEYTGRYAAYAEHLASRGVIFAGHDHLGHGDTATDDASLGFFAEKDGVDFLVDDVYKMTGLLTEKYPDLPIFLLGHSMGSFVARLYIVKYPGVLSGAIIMGTGGPEAPTGAGIFLSDLISLFSGFRRRSGLLKKISFAGYTKRFGKGCDPNAWLTREDDVVKRYDADKFCTFTFTASAYRDLFTMLSDVSGKEWASEVPTDLPILLISGGDDPVGNYGRGVASVGRMLAGAGVRDLTLEIIPGARHEVLNETNREETFAYIDGWIDERMPAQPDGDKDSSDADGSDDTL